MHLVLKAGQVAEDNVLFAHAWVLLSSQKGSKSTSVGFGNKKFSEPRERVHCGKVEHAAVSQSQHEVRS